MPLFEAVMNSIHSIQESGREDGRIVIEVRRSATSLDEESPVEAFDIQDNGVGFDDDNFDSFNEAFSERKLGRGGKGLGRFTWLKAFERVEIESVFKENAETAWLSRALTFDENYDPDDVGFPLEAAGPPSTTVRLEGYREPYRSDCPKNTDQLIERLIEHFILVFLHDKCPQIELIDNGLRRNVNSILRPTSDKGLRRTHS